MSDLKSEFLFDIVAGLDSMLEVGKTPYGQRMIAYVTEGVFKGPRLTGKVLPGGGDWVLVRSDGVLSIDVRITLETHDGVRIYVTYGGRLVIPPELLGIVINPETAETVDPAKYYFRTLPLFEAPEASSYAWLNNVAAVGVGRFTSRGVAYRVHAIL